MDLVHRTSLENDLDYARAGIAYVREFPRQNYGIKKARWVDPEFDNKALPVDDERGRLMYLRRLEGIIQRLLDGELVPEDSVPGGFPDYLEGLR